MSDLLRKVQLKEYEMLKELDRICKKHNIKYYLGQGTLLGAAKYKKFIPWDDDIDLLIPYKELVKLMKVFKEDADERYILTNCFIEKHFPVAWSKIRNKDTLSRPVRYKAVPINWGICIDLFPVYPVSNVAFIRKLEKILYKAANKMLLAEFTKYEDGHGAFVRLLEKLPISVRHMYFKMVIKLLNMHGDKTEYVMVTCKIPKLVKRDRLFGEEKTIFFEDAEFPAPTEYHTYLTETYGDYMAPLPENEQRGHDLLMGDIEWKLDIKSVDKN